MLRERLLKPEVASFLAEKAWKKLKTGLAPRPPLYFPASGAGQLEIVGPGTLAISVEAERRADQPGPHFSGFRRAFLLA
jgi:hypothetical protein